MTLKATDGARNVIFLVSGAPKGPALGRLLQGKPGEDCPASLVLNLPENVEVYADEAAAVAVARRNQGIGDGAGERKKEAK